MLWESFMGESQPQTAFSFPWTSLQLPPRCFYSGLQCILHLCPTPCFSSPFLPGFCQLCSLPPLPPSTYPIAFSFFFFQLCSISLPSAFSLISLASCPPTCMFVTPGLSSQAVSSMISAGGTPEKQAASCFPLHS